MTRLTLLGIIVSLCSCASVRPLQTWPEYLPDQRYFQAAYEADPVNSALQREAEYLNWIVDFYQGTLLYPQGWQVLSSSVLTRSSASYQAAIVPKLGEAGQLIAIEWAKHNSVRRIDNRLLSLWGSVIQVADSEVKRIEAIDVIVADVKELVAGSIVASDITAQRYDQWLQSDEFDEFELTF